MNQAQKLPEYINYLDLHTPPKRTKEEERKYARDHQNFRIKEQEKYITYCEEEMQKKDEEIKKLKLELYKYEALLDR